MSKFETVPAKPGNHIPGRAGIAAGAPVATFDGYIDGEPFVKWRDRANMPPAGAKLYAGAAVPSLSTAPEATRQDLVEVFDLAWNQALADAALYVASHCSVEEHHVERILELVPPTVRVRGVEIALRPDEAGAAGAGAGRRAEDAHAETRMDTGSQPAVALAPAVGVRAAFIEWHEGEFGYCFADEKSFTDGDLQAVAWAAWKEAHARTDARQANGEIA